jgi:hypothetical protein
MQSEPTLEPTVDMATDYATLTLKHIEGMGMDTVIMELPCGNFIGDSHTRIFESVEVVELGGREHRAKQKNMLKLQEVLTKLTANPELRIYTTLRKTSPYCTTHILWKKWR